MIENKFDVSDHFGWLHKILIILKSILLHYIYKAVNFIIEIQPETHITFDLVMVICANIMQFT